MGLFIALTVLLTWPQIVQPDGILPHRDSWFNMWRLGWVAHQVPRDPARLFDANIHYPEQNTLAYSDAIVVPGLIATPLLAAGVPPPHTHTVLVLVSFVFAAWSIWLLVRTLTGSFGAGLVAGVAFAFSAFRFDHYMHLELLWSGWMPLCLLAIHRTVGTRSFRAAASAGLLFAAQTMSSIYYGVFFATMLLPFTAIAAVRAPREHYRAIALRLAVGGVMAILVLLPYMRPYWQARDALGERSHGEAGIYSAGPKHYLAPMPGSFLYDGVADRVGSHEKRLFPGAIAVVLAGAGAFPPFTALRVAYAVGALVAVDLSFGHRGLLFNGLRGVTDVYRGLRAPARAGGLALMMIAVLAGLGWARVEEQARQQGWTRTSIATAIVIALMVVEYGGRYLQLIPAPTHPEPVQQWLAAQPPAPAIEFPLPNPRDLPGHDPEIAFFSTFHWQRIVNGYSGNVPRSYMDVLQQMQTFPDAASLEYLERLGVRYVVVHERFYGVDAFAAVVARLDAGALVRARHASGGPGERTVAYELTRRPHE